MNSLIYHFKDNGEESYNTTKGFLLEDFVGNQIQFNEGDTCLHISLKGAKDLITIENGFISIGSEDYSPKIWCSYSKGMFYFCIWFLDQGSYSGFFGISRDGLGKTMISGRNFLKYSLENPEKAIDNYIRSTIFNQVVIKSTKTDVFLNVGYSND